MQLTGLHHVTLISRRPGAHDRLLPRHRSGLRSCARRPNADDPGARHFWFGDGAGTPGTLVTFLEYPRLPEATVGRGSTHHFAFAVDSAPRSRTPGATSCARATSTCTEVFERGGFRSIYFRDPDGHILEIATT